MRAAALDRNRVRFNAAEIVERLQARVPGFGGCMVVRGGQFAHPAVGTRHVGPTEIRPSMPARIERAAVPSSPLRTANFGLRSASSAAPGRCRPPPP